MIHTIEITSETEPASLKKLFRKKLMTGGAVLRVAPELSNEEVSVLLERFTSVAEAHNVSSMVLVELAKSGLLDATQKQILRDLGLSNVSRVLGAS